MTPELEEVAHLRGYQGTSKRQRGMLQALDSNLYPTVVEEDWVLVTNNEIDFRRLARREKLHPGLIVLPQRQPEVQKGDSANSIEWEWWPDDPGA